MPTLSHFLKAILVVGGAFLLLWIVALLFKLIYWLVFSKIIIALIVFVVGVYFAAKQMAEEDGRE